MPLTATVNRQSNDELDVSFTLAAGDTAEAYTFPIQNLKQAPSVSLVAVDGSFVGQSVFMTALTRLGFTINKTAGIAAACRGFIKRPR